MWTTVKLGDVCELAYGKALDKKDRLEAGGYPAFGANGIKTQSKEPLFDKPSIIIGRKGSAGEINKAAEPFWALDVTYYTKIDEAVIDLDYLFYVLTTLNLPSLARGVKPGINRNDVYRQAISLPPLAEQQRIVAKLDAAFAEIDSAIKRVEAKQANAERLKASLLDVLLKGGDALWKTVKLGDVLKTGAGGTPLKSKKNYYEGGKIKWLLSGAVCEKEIKDSKTHITEDGLSNSSAKLFPNNSVLVAMYGATAGQVGILRTEAATNQAVCGIYPSKDYLPEFLYYYLSNYKETLLLEVSGVAQPNLSQLKIKNIPLPCISLAEQQRIVAKLDAAFAKIETVFVTTTKSKAHYCSLKSAILTQELQPPQSEAA